MAIARSPPRNVARPAAKRRQTAGRHHFDIDPVAEVSGAEQVAGEVHRDELSEIGVSRLNGELLLAAGGDPTRAMALLPQGRPHTSAPRGPPLRPAPSPPTPRLCGCPSIFNVISLKKIILSFRRRK